jgi:NTE family protein
MSTVKPINLALQGGGAHGAFTWGVLDAILEDERLDIEGVSGTSAGAMNAAILLSGLAKGGREGARKALAAFWRDVSVDGNLSDGTRLLMDVFLAPWRAAEATQGLFENARNLMSPYDINPLDINPLRRVVADHIDFKALRAADGPKLFVAATSVHSGKVRVFRRDEVDLDVLMASAALPYLFRAVEIDGEPYWDGGYMGNPALFPFFSETAVEDVVLVQINPLERDTTPESSTEIMERINEITFNGPLLHELRAIEFVQRLITQGTLRGTRYKSIRMHRIEAQQQLNGFGAASKLQFDWSFFQTLFKLGRSAALHFLAEHYEDIGVKGTLDLARAIKDPVRKRVPKD